jgi:hypothetical protein
VLALGALDHSVRPGTLNAVAKLLWKEGAFDNEYFNVFFGAEE